MGCSPSKGQLFSKKAIQSESPESKKNADLLSDGTQLLIKAEISTASEGLAAAEIAQNENYVKGKRPSVVNVVCDAAVTVKEDANEKILDVVRSQGGQSTLLENQKEGTEENRTKVKQGKRRKQRTHKLRKNSYAQSKAEFILKAHQAAYAYLNPSLSKYESLLGLLGQAAQTHLSVQTTAASVVLHYEEINQALEEMAAEGEQLLREHGHNMTWPASLKDYPPTTTKPSSNEQHFSQLPSELLQQMLLHSSAKMISVGDSVKCLSDSALQELADYYGSLSQLIGEKLLAKHAAEERLKLVLSHVEAAALRKPSPEDSALHSEDSGIGADNECQNGSERLRRNRGSSGSGANAGIISVLINSCSPDQPFLNANEDVTDDDDDDDDDEDEDEDAEPENKVSGKDEQGRLTDKIMCGSPEPDSVPPSVSGTLQRQDQVNLKRKTRRPKTADNTFQVKLKYRHLRGPKRSQSAECLCSKAEGSDPNQQQVNLRNKQTPHWRRKNYLPEDNAHGGHVWPKIRRGSSGAQSAARYYGLQYGSKGPFRAIPPNSPPTFTPEPPGRNAVKRLINTFSQGVEDHSRQSPSDQKPTRVRDSKKCTLPLLQNSRGALTTSGNIKSRIYPREPRLADRPEQLDIDSLPPPPPEMLMDNSFENGSGLPTEEGAHDLQSRRQRLRASTQRETMLSKRDSIATHPVRQDALPGSCIEEEYKKVTEVHSERDAAHTLDQKFPKAVHLPAESSAKTAPANAGLHGSTPYQECEIHNEGNTTTMQAKCFPPTTPPVSRTRLPPSCPTVHHAVPTPPSTACPHSGRWTPSTTSATSSMHRCATAEENSFTAPGSQSFFEARSVFCQENKSLSQTLTRSCTSTLPRPWGEPARGRLPTTRLQPSLMGHTSSGQRSSHSEQAQSSPNATQQQDQDNDVTSLTSEGTNMRADDSGADSQPSAADVNVHSGFVGEEITD